MQLDCGPAHDRRSIKIEIPYTDSTIGVFVSGGLDSALLFWLLQQANKNLNNKLIPIVVLKKGSDLAQINNLLLHLGAGTPVIHHRYETTNGLAIMRSVLNTIHDTCQFRQVYLGVLEELPTFLDNWEPHNFASNYWAIGPMCNLNKSHTVDLVNQLGLSELYHLTHSCAEQATGRCNVCNRCKERQWAFDSLALTDPGVL